MPNSSVSRYPVTTSELAMNVFDGTQSLNTQAPPAPSASTTVTSASSCAATSAASYPAGPPPMMTIRATLLSKVLDASDMPITQRHSAPNHAAMRSSALTLYPHSALRPAKYYRHRRASLRRLWLEPGPRAHA